MNPKLDALVAALEAIYGTELHGPVMATAENVADLRLKLRDYKASIVPEPAESTDEPWLPQGY